MDAAMNVGGWWEDVNNSTLWQNRIFCTLSGLYGLVAFVALIQLVRIELRVPEYGWTTQKVFHFLNFLVNAARSLVFVFRRGVQNLRPEILQHVLLDMPGLVFFTTYALLVLFWAEIYYQARGVSTDGLRSTFLTINGVIYAIQIALWLVMWWKPLPLVVTLSKLFFAGVSLFAALGFLLYGGRLFLMLQRFPVESKGRRKKLQEVGYVTTICFTCFFVRCIMMCFCAFDKAANLDVLNHPLLNFIYYLVIFLIIHVYYHGILAYIWSSKVSDKILSSASSRGLLTPAFLSKEQTSSLDSTFYQTLSYKSTSTVLQSLLLHWKGSSCWFVYFNKTNGPKAPGCDAWVLHFWQKYLVPLVEIVPCALVLFILRKLPPKRGVTQYHPIR